MIVEQLDAALRAGAACTCLLLAWLMLAYWRQLGQSSLLFAPLAICLASFVLGNTPLSFAVPLGVPGDIAHGLSGFAVIFLWWFSLSCFDRRFRLKGGVLVTGIAWALIAAADRGLFGAWLDQLGLSRVLVVMGFGIVGHLVWRLLAERRRLVKRRQLMQGERRRLAEWQPAERRQPLLVGRKRQQLEPVVGLWRAPLTRPRRAGL